MLLILTGFVASKKGELDDAKAKAPEFDRGRT